MQQSQIKIGNPVIYWRVVTSWGDKFDPMHTHIISMPKPNYKGQMVCNVKGIVGGVLINHLQALQQKELIT